MEIKLSTHQNPISQSIPDIKSSTETESVGLVHTAKSVITELVTEQPIPISNQLLNPVESSPAQQSNDIKVQAIDHKQADIGQDQLTPATDIKIEFQIISGNDGKLLDSGQQHFALDGRNNYQLDINSNHSENDAYENWDIEITGALYSNRLSPSKYYTNGTQAYKLLRLSRISREELISAEPTKGMMPDGLLDRQSLIYQFMFSPPTSTDSKLFLTDGAKISIYTVHLLNIELLDTTSYGKLTTVHLVLSNSDNNETIDLWLAPTFKYLPFKIRHVQPDGKITEQLIQTVSIK
ncbi:DUF3108 domain-containing protein [Methyloradius palustris]|uniref:DUF3108 domain-containing protein n=1 Tax=Methyloradius palustris TaxID=2778876 RepID=A0A8D5JXH9_9PROT|nr:DUF3108 domain-containing protein [Methyloradius palustris]BCM26144.1 hypothetical protein ZMTM_24030 [Methyloradius palustris]